MLDYLGINDKLEHGLAYFSLALLPALHESRRRLLWIAPALAALGVLLEYGQRLSPGRDFEIGDMAADAAGVALGIAAGWRARASFAARCLRGEGHSG